MFLARVTGTVVSTIKNDTLHAHKLLLVRPIDAQGVDLARTLVAVDAVGAGMDEVVYCCRGKEASFAFPASGVPTDTAIVGIADPESNAGIAGAAWHAAGARAPR